jgi:hypothetical protein
VQTLLQSSPATAGTTTTTMRPITATTAPDTITAALAMAYGAGRVIVRDLLIPLLALCITLATLHRERDLPVLPKPPLALPAATAQPLEALTVVQLRQMARAAGHKQLARSGRKADLLQVLA